MPGGQGNGRGSQRSGRGRNNRRDRKNGNGNKRSSENSKCRSLSECIYSVGTSNQTSEYEVITAHLINHIKKTYKWGSDIEYALTNMTNFDFIAIVPVEGTVPTTVTDPTEQDKRKASLKLVYEQEIKRYIDRMLEYEANKIKAYSFLHD